MAVLESLKKLTGAGTKEKGGVQEVEFTYYAPGAKKVYLVGKFNNWNTKSLPMKKGKDGIWRTTIKLAPGRYEYKYLVDGSWARELPCSDMVMNPYGTYNCVIGVE